MTPDLEEETVDYRRYPGRPIVGVAGAVVREGKVLLIRRGQEPMKGAWTLPGGALEVGETILDGVAREVLEETGLVVRPLELLALLDRIVRDERDAVEYHYVLLDWLCAVAEAEDQTVARAGSDALEAAWVSADELADMAEIDEATRRVITDALARMEARG